MDLHLYLEILKRRGLIILVVAIVAVLVVVTVDNFVIEHVYSTTTTVNVVLDVGVTNSGLYQDYTVRLLNTYAYILQSDPFLQATVNLLPQRSSALTLGDLKKNVNINVETLLNTSILSISVQSKDPVLAEDLANTLANLLVTQGQSFLLGSSKSTLKVFEDQLAGMVSDLNIAQQKYTQLVAQGNSGSEAQALADQIKSKQDAYSSLLNRYELQKAITSLQANSLTVVSPASLPLAPTNSLGLFQLGLAVIVGLFGGLATALVVENLDTRIYSLEQLERLSSVPVLGTVPEGSLTNFKSKVKEKPNERLMDAYRLLAMNFQSVWEDSGRTVVITSPQSREGKSAFAVNLAQIFSEGEKPVILVECNMRHPTLEKIFGIDDKLGLTALLDVRNPLTNEMTVKVIHPINKLNLWVIASGPKVANPVALLSSPRMSSLLDYLRTQGKMILLDSTAVLGRADVSVLAPKADAVVIVVRKGKTQREQVLNSIKQLEAAHAHILGYVFLGNNN